jgi:hypothetical protein
VPAESDPAAELFAVDPDAFVEARNRLVKELRAGGQRDEAARVAKLRRPPPTAWALNQVARQRPELVEAVLDTGARLREAMEDALAGDPSGVRASQAAERRAVDAAVGAAAKVLEEAGRPAADAVKLRMAASLRAAVVDESVAELVRGGVLDADRDAPGFGLDGLSVSAAPAAARRSRPAKAAPERRATRAPDAEAETDEKAAADAERAERRRLACEADEAEDLARRLLREAADAEHRAAQLAVAAAEATAEAERTRQRAEQLEAEARAAAEHAGSARTDADAAESRARDARRRAEAG